MLDQMASHRTPRGLSIVLIALMSAACGGTIAPGSEAAPASAGPASAIRPATVTLGPTARPSQTPGPSGTPLPSGVLASIPLKVGGVGGGAPSVATIGFGSVWVESHRGTQLFRIDPTSDRVIATIDVGQESCGEPEAGFGSVWLGPCDSSTKTIAVDAATNQVAGSFDALGGSEVFTNDALWIVDSSGKLSKVDPKSYRTVATYDIFPGASITWVVDAGGSIWVGSQNGETGQSVGELVRVDPSNGRVISRLMIPDPGPYATMTADLGYIWVKGDDSGRLMRIDPKTGEVKTFDLPGFKGLTQLYDMWPATGLGSVWVRLANDTVARVDPETGKVTGTYPADEAGGGGWPTVGFGSLWVPNFGSDSIWRDRVTP